VVFKQGYRMDLDLQGMPDDSAVFVLDNVNTYSGFTRIGGGRLSFTSKGKWGAIVMTGDANTSTPNGSVICNGSTGSLRVDFNGTSQVTGGLSGNGGVFANNLAGTCSVLTVGAGNISNSVWPTGGSGQNGKITDNTTGTGGMVALTKIGTGTIGFPTAQNNYSGPTTINNGVLEFTATGAPSANSDHQINSPGMLKLSYSGTKNVNSLFINGSQLPAGTYDATSHPAFITGSGTITVVQVHPPTVPALITITRAGGSSTITWNGCGLLQSSTDLTNWTDLSDAVSPHVSPDSGLRKFWRLR
jgi:autotransporter-associated beta strand protein